MNSESLNKHLAEKVMGWEMPSGDIWWSDGVAKAFESSWNPTENIEQAFMCLDTLDHPAYRIDFSITKTHQLSFWPDVTYSQNKFEAKHKSLPTAISLACARATGWEE